MRFKLRKINVIIFNCQLQKPHFTLNFLSRLTITQIGFFSCTLRLFSLVNPIEAIFWSVLFALFQVPSDVTYLCQFPSSLWRLWSNKKLVSFQFLVAFNGHLTELGLIKEMMGFGVGLLLWVWGKVNLVLDFNKPDLISDYLGWR